MADSNSMLPAWGCNICLEESRDPVCTSCGHLFCWPCLYPWVHDMAKPCPVCRSSLTLHDNIIPVYVTTQAERAPQAATNAVAAAATSAIPPRPHPRAPTASTSAAAAVRIAPRPFSWAPTTSFLAPDHDSNAVHSRVHMYRETVESVREQEALERTRLAMAEEQIEYMQNYIDADARILARKRRELKELRRRQRALVVSSAGSGTTRQDQAASTGNSAPSHGVLDTDIDRAHGTEIIRRVLTAIVGRRIQ